MTGAAVTVEITGGLGNQMFQYAAARSLALRLDAPLRLDLGFYRAGRHRTFELDRLAVPPALLREAPASRLARLAGRLLGQGGASYEEPHFHYDPAFAALSAPVRLKGYFQSPRYFEAHADTIRSELMPPAASDAESRDLAAVLSAAESVALHIRRGDYVTSAKAQAIYAQCTLGYYAEALSRLPGDGPVVVFSDDIAWARANLSSPRRLVFAGEKAPRDGLADLHLMTRARHHVIANSSFSWWGAWLAGEDGVTIAPDRWFNDPAVRDGDLFPPRWQRIPVAGTQPV